MVSHRARRILLTVVGDFIATGEPVSSRTLVAQHALDLSPASVRAVLAELEAAGFLIKPHTSAGRVPTEKGIRCFAEAVIEMGDGGAAASSELERLYTSGEATGIDDLLKLTTRRLAELTGSAALVRPPSGETWVLKELRFIALRPKEVLAVIVASTGAVENRVMKLDVALTASEVERMNNLLRPLVEGRTLAEVRAHLARELDGVRATHDRFARTALEMGHQALAGVSAGSEVFVDGAARLIERPEFGDAERTRQLVRALEDQTLLLDLLDRAMQSAGLQVVFGGEDNEMGSELTLVATNFGSGAVGVIGSNRMDYAQVVPLVREAAQRLTRAIKRS